MNRVSPKPRVVIRPVFAPVRSIRAFVAWVVPWPKATTSPRNCSRGCERCAANSSSASNTPFSSSPGVVGALPVATRPCPSITTRSVNVPPMSTPTYSMRSPSLMTQLAPAPARRRPPGQGHGHQQRAPVEELLDIEGRPELLQARDPGGEEVDREEGPPGVVAAGPDRGGAQERAGERRQQEVRSHVR